MLGNSKWAPGGPNDEGEANTSTQPANAPTGPRDTQHGRRRGTRRGGKEANNERTGRTDNVEGAKSPPQFWSGRYPPPSLKIDRDIPLFQNHPTTSTSNLPQNESFQSGVQQQVGDKADTPPAKSHTGRKDDETHIVGAVANPDIETRIRELEDRQNNTHDNVDALEQLYNHLSASVKNLKYFKYNPVNPSTPLARPTVSYAANNGLFRVPKQGNLSDTDFLFLLKKLAGRQISIEEWDNAVKQIKSWDFGSTAITSQSQTATADVRNDDSAEMHLKEATLGVDETKAVAGRSMEREKKTGEKRDEAEEKEGSFPSSVKESDDAEKL